MNPRIATALVLVAALAAGAMALAASGEREDAAPAASEGFEGARIPAGVRAPDFALENQDGDTIRMRDLRGRPVVVTFLYTDCDDTCPPQAHQVVGALDELGHDVPALAIAVDPANDTPDSARRFLAENRLVGRIDFVLGSREELGPLWDAYAVRPQSVKEEHQARTVLVDPRGFQRVGFPLDKTTPERLAHDLRLLEMG
ncbi:MAG: SCO family protein [Thermoleophilaceae bacterium]